jgi:hypothetical protein
MKRTFDAITIGPCTDKDWREANRHQIEAEGWDGGGLMQVSIPLNDDELGELIAYLVEYRNAHPRE